MRLLLLAVPLSLLVGCDPEQAQAADGILAGVETWAAGLGGVGGLGLLWLVRIARTASRAAKTAEGVAAGPSRSAEDVSELYRRVERVEALLMEAGIRTVAAGATESHGERA